MEHQTLSSSEALIIAKSDSYPDVDMEALKQAVLADILDSFEDEFNDATLELIGLKVCDCDNLDAPVIENALRKWMEIRMNKILGSLAHDAYRSHEFKDILAEEKHRYWTEMHEDAEF